MLVIIPEFLFMPSEQVYIHFTDLKGAKGMLKSKELWQSSYIEAIYAIAVGAQYVPDVQRSSLGRAQTRNYAVYFTTPVKPDYCHPEECVWHGKSIPIQVIKVIPSNLAVKRDLTGTIPVDPETDQLIGVDTTERPMSKFPTLKEIFLDERPEAAPTDPLGISFDDPSKIKPETNPPEPNTPFEKNLVNQLTAFIDWEREGVGQLGKTLMSLKPFIQQGKYPQLAPPPKALVYRGMVLSAKDFAQIVKMSENEVIEKPGTGWYVGTSGILNPKTKNPFQVSSWTLDPNIALNFAIGKADTSRERGDSIFVIFTARTDNPKNNFFVNPRLAQKTYKFVLPRNHEEYQKHPPNPLVTSVAKKEQEVFGVGSIVFTDFAFYAKPGENFERMYWKQTADAPEFPFFWQMVEQQLSKKEFVENYEEIDKALRVAMSKVIQKFKWKEAKNSTDALANMLDVERIDYEAWKDATEHGGGGGAPVSTKNVLSALKKMLLSMNHIFPQDTALYNPKSSLLYSLGLIKKEPKKISWDQLNESHLNRLIFEFFSLS